MQIALRDTGQSRRVAGFLLSWWNAKDCGGFDLTDLRQVDGTIATDMVTVFKMIAEHHHHPDTLGYGPQFEQLVALWKPALKK
ncbi:MAG: DUF7673 family protein [bacterium]